MDALSVELCSTARAARWFLESSIQHLTGGVSRYYRLDTQELRPVSTEITGYVAATLSYVYRRTRDFRCLEAATRAGLLLTRRAWNAEAGTMPFEWPSVSDTGATSAYFFDLGIVARALGALWRHTKIGEFLQTARACTRSMARDFAVDAGYCAILDLPHKHAVPPDGHWSRRQGCYQLKAAMAWAELGGPEYETLYENVLAAALRSQSSFLAAEARQDRLMDYLHAYCYFLEGLLPRASRPECASALESGIRLVERLVWEIGSRFERSDVRAQLLRLRLYASSLGVAPLDHGVAAEEASRIQSFQLNSDDPRVDGAFCFGRRGTELMPFANPASTVFCVQALEMWEEYQRGEFRTDPLELI